MRLSGWATPLPMKTLCPGLMLATACSGVMTMLAYLVCHSAS